MARVSCALKTVFVISVFIGSQAFGGEPKSPTGIGADLNDPKTVDAFRQYWNAYDHYESMILKKGRKKYKDALTRLRKSFALEQKKISAAQLSSLRMSAKKYQRQLEKFATAENRPFVMLNLAQVLNLIGDHLKTTMVLTGLLPRMRPWFCWQT